MSEYTLILVLKIIKLSGRLYCGSLQLYHYLKGNITFFYDKVTTKVKSMRDITVFLDSCVRVST